MPRAPVVRILRPSQDEGNLSDTPGLMLGLSKHEAGCGLRFETQ